MRRIFKTIFKKIKTVLGLICSKLCFIGKATEDDGVFYLLQAIWVSSSVVCLIINFGLFLILS